VAENALRERAKMEAQIKYLQSQLGKLMEEKRRSLRSARSPVEQDARFEPEREESHPNGSSGEGEEERRSSRCRGSNNLDFKVDIPEFEGQLDPDLFLDWLHMVERVSDYKDIPEEKKVKLVGLKLRKYASIWWANLCLRELGKEKLRSVLGIKEGQIEG